MTIFILVLLSEANSPLKSSSFHFFPKVPTAGKNYRYQTSAA